MPVQKWMESARAREPPLTWLNAALWPAIRTCAREGHLREREQAISPVVRYVVRPLAPERVDQAFPVVRVVNRRLGLDDWRAYAQALAAAGRLDAPRGVVTAETEDGYIHGLFSYVVVPNLWSERTMFADLFVAVGLRGGADAAHVLLDAMEEIARRD